MLAIKDFMSRSIGSESGNRNGFKKIALFSLAGTMVMVLFGALVQWLTFSTLKHHSPGLLGSDLVGLLIVISIVFFLSGAIKGLAGIGMGLVAVPILSLIYHPVLVVCLIAVPLVVTNFWQGVVRGKAREVVVRYPVLFIAMTLAMLGSGYFAGVFSVAVTSFTLGLTAIVFAVMNLGITLPRVSDAHDTSLQICCGALAGFVGGLTGLVVIPLVFYMVCRRVNKDEFVSALGLLLLISGVMLVFCYGLNGGMTAELMMLSAFASAPALLGVVVGEHIRPYVNDLLFRKMVLYIVLAIGVKILLTV